ncbi:uncharacterized protein METZ01_LOCUS485565 [marine metagenome]|uniref:Uncharacterized protein n=1 Tax=marine metagenome TaxID=408172 RepID=A0A383CKR3_9ZZZZ
MSGLISPNIDKTKTILIMNVIE